MSEQLPENILRAKDVRVGTVLWERYEVLAVMGAGDLGELWRCRDLVEHKDVVVRELVPALRRSKTVLNSIHEGIQRLSLHTHPNISIIRQLVYVGEDIFLLGDYAEGVPVLVWREKGEGGARMYGEIMSVLRQAADALDFAHRYGVLHRNLKPANIFVDEKGTARVSEFGFAPFGQLTLIGGVARRTGMTGAYLAPELLRGQDPDSASDQYALAVLAWHLFEGDVPDDGRLDVFPDSIPRSARPALSRALAKKPRKRFVSCADFVKALGGERVTRRRGRSRRELLRIWSRVVAIVLGLGLAAAGAWLLNAFTENMKQLREQEALEQRRQQRRAVIVPEEKPAWAPPAPLEAKTSLPSKGFAWVAHTVPMEFMWIPPLQIWVGRYEVTNEEYQRMDPDHTSGEDQGVCMSGKRQPVVRVNFEDTMEYVDWFNEQERAAGKLPDDLAYRLPTRAEAIAYTKAGMGYSFPWGELWPPTRGNYADTAYSAAFGSEPSIRGYQDGFAVTAPVEQRRKRLGIVWRGRQCVGNHHRRRRIQAVWRLAGRGMAGSSAKPNARRSLLRLFGQRARLCQWLPACFGAPAIANHRGKQAVLPVLIVFVAGFDACLLIFEVFCEFSRFL